jgi:hypothetical protein
MSRQCDGSQECSGTYGSVMAQCPVLVAILLALLHDGAGLFYGMD